MTDTPEADPLASLDSNRDALRAALIEAGFVDDGSVLRGSVDWSFRGRNHTATIDIAITERFPFAPPQVIIVDAGTELEPTFHIEHNDVLCLWGSDMPIESWQTPEALIKKVAGWLEQTAQGWPGDEDADLERYLEQDDDHVVIYDMEQIKGGDFFRTALGDYGILRIKDKLPWQPNSARMKNKGIRRRERRLAWVVDVGQVDHPIRGWHDLIDAVGNDCATIIELIKVGSVELILVRYRRGTREALLALNALTLKAYESADSSVSTRTLRSGTSAPYRAKKSVAIIGCGAIGSHIADLLFRSGVHRITLIDPERLRPGNIIRHLADNSLVGLPKTVAVKAELNALGIDASEVQLRIGRVTEPADALRLVTTHDLVVDTTADARATELLIWATKELDRHMISVCLQRDGGIARVDRFPLWEDEHHLEPIPLLESKSKKVYEKGCGSPVSTTPPLAVVKAAALGSQVALDQINNMGQYLPATIIEIITPQPNEPYDKLGTITSDETDHDADI